MLAAVLIPAGSSGPTWNCRGSMFLEMRETMEILEGPSPAAHVDIGGCNSLNCCIAAVEGVPFASFRCCIHVLVGDLDIAMVPREGDACARQPRDPEGGLLAGRKR